jgi:hypothetical protein
LIVRDWHPAGILELRYVNNEMVMHYFLFIAERIESTEITFLKP